MATQPFRIEVTYTGLNKAGMPVTATTIEMCRGTLGDAELMATLFRDDHVRYGNKGTIRIWSRGKLIQTHQIP